MDRFPGRMLRWIQRPPLLTAPECLYGVGVIGIALEGPLRRQDPREPQPHDREAASADRPRGGD